MQAHITTVLIYLLLFEVLKLLLEYKHNSHVNYGNTFKPYISFAIAKIDWVFLFALHVL
jgi:hypothetical protein